MSQKFSVDYFEWIKETSQFNEDFKENYNEESDEGYFILKNYINLIMIYHLYQKE